MTRSRSAMFRLREFAVACAGVVMLGLSAPAYAFEARWGDETELLEDIIAMDAEDIAELREGLVEARAEIAEAVLEIEQAKAEATAAPFGRFFSKAAFRAASAGVSAGVAGLEEAFGAVDRAKALLVERRGEIGEAEFIESSGALAMLREELAALQAALEGLAAAMRA